MRVPLPLTPGWTCPTLEQKQQVGLATEYLQTTIQVHLATYICQVKLSIMPHPLLQQR